MVQVCLDLTEEERKSLWDTLYINSLILQSHDVPGGERKVQILESILKKLEATSPEPF